MRPRMRPLKVHWRVGMGEVGDEGEVEDGPAASR